MSAAAGRLRCGGLGGDVLKRPLDRFRYGRRRGQVGSLWQEPRLVVGSVSQLDQGAIRSLVRVLALDCDHVGFFGVLRIGRLLDRSLLFHIDFVARLEAARIKDEASYLFNRNFKALIKYLYTYSQMGKQFSDTLKQL